MLIQLKIGSKRVTPKNEPKSALAAEQGESVQASAVRTEPARERHRPAADPHEPPKAGGPRIETYVAASVSEAMLMARRELGEEAILIQTTPRQKTGNAPGQYEVTFGVIPGAPPAKPPRTAAQTPEPREDIDRVAGGAPDGSEVAKALGSLQREIAALHSLLVQSTLGKGSPPLAINYVSNIYTMLVHHDVDPDLAADVARGVQERIERAHPAGHPDAAATEPDRALALLAEQLRSHVRTDDTLGSGESPGKAVLLVGPPAVGKTTTLIKLAVEFGLKRGKRVEILSIARFKPEANHALESMAGVLNIPYRASASVTALTVALSRSREENTLVLVDTSGYGSGPVEQQMELASFAQSGHEVDVHLALPATWHAASIRQAVDRFEIFQPSRLLFTMFDQTVVYGSMIQEAWRTGKPLSFFSSGPLGSGYVTPASLEQILKLMWDSTGTPR